MMKFSFPGIIHGADYNPDQWLHDPTVLAEDIRLMKAASFNAVSLGIFAWAALEPEEGRFELDWMGNIIDSLHENGIATILATPSGARPAWLAQRYPEVLRVTAEGVRRSFGERHNHCYTSPLFRAKVGTINRRLAERFGSHPGVVLWHLSNEYGGECFCPLCGEAFRSWLKVRYGKLDALNLAWWNAFWSHSYSDWSQIEPPSPLGETMVHGLTLDWKRFVTVQSLDFMRDELAALRAAGSALPAATNFMGTYDGLDYWEFVDDLDVISWDSYPGWHGLGPKTNPWCDWDEGGQDWRLASNVAFLHDLNRSFKKAPFLLMESTPSATNWQPVSKLKRPGMHALSSIQAVAHGSDSVQYFQWRKSRGAFEKFHGAVVDHAGHENTRVFREVAELGLTLKRLATVAGSSVEARAAVLFDWENRWALENAAGPRNDGLKQYKEDCLAHYSQLWKRSVPVDILDRRADFSSYRLVAAPMLYLAREDTVARLEDFVRSGGTLVGTYWSGIVDETDLCHLGGFPGPLRRLFGLWAEEIDALYSEERRSLTMSEPNGLGFGGSFALRHLWERIHPEGAEVLGTFDQEFLASCPAVTVNRFGSGKAYYLASRNEEAFLDALYGALTASAGIEGSWPAALPEGVSVSARRGAEGIFRFVMNFSPASVALPLPSALDGAESLVGSIERGGDGLLLRLKPWGFAVLVSR